MLTANSNSAIAADTNLPATPANTTSTKSARKSVPDATKIISGSLVQLAIANLALHPFNVRRLASKEGIEELAASIREHGILEPLLVVPRPESRNIREEAAELGYSLPDGDTTGSELAELKRGIEEDDVANFWVLAGNRRLAAARLAGLSQVPCIIREDMRTLREQQLVMLVENMQRENLNPIEQARTFKALRSSGMSSQEIAQKIGRGYNSVHDYLRLLDLPQLVQERIAARQISYMAAVITFHSELTDTDRQLILAELVMHNLSIKQVRERVMECVETQHKRTAQIREAQALMLYQNQNQPRGQSSPAGQATPASSVRFRRCITLTVRFTSYPFWLDLSGMLSNRSKAG